MSYMGWHRRKLSLIDYLLLSHVRIYLTVGFFLDCMGKVI